MSNVPPPPPPVPPMDVIPYARPEFNLPFKDNRTGLKVWGILLIVTGTITGCFTLMMPVGAAFIYRTMPASQMPGRAGALVGLIVATGMYAFVTGFLIWTGVGSLKYQRWVRPVLLVLSGLTIAMSVNGAISMIATLPSLGSSMSAMNVTVNTRTATTAPSTVAVAPMPMAGMWFGVLIGVAMIGLLGIAVPAALFWFYRQEDTRLTLEFFDQRTRWTDGVPVPVLGITITAALVGATMLIGSAQQWFLMSGGSTPFTHWVWLPALNLIVMMLMFVTAVLSYTMHRNTWPIALIAVLVACTAWLVSLNLVDLDTQLRSMGFNATEVSSFRGMSSMQKTSQVLSIVIVGGEALAYLFWCRKFLGPAQVVSRE